MPVCRSYVHVMLTPTEGTEGLGFCRARASSVFCFDCECHLGLIHVFVAPDDDHDDDDDDDVVSVENSRYQLFSFTSLS